MFARAFDDADTSCGEESRDEFHSANACLESSVLESPPPRKTWVSPSNSAAPTSDPSVNLVNEAGSLSLSLARPGCGSVVKDLALP